MTATLLPAQTIQIVSNRLNHNESLTELLLQLPNPLWRQSLSTLFEVWQKEASYLHPQSIAIALELSHYSLQKSKESLAAEIVWTGPSVSRIPVRQTEQVLLQMIQGAKTELMIVSFAIYKVADVAKALLEAVHRGVSVTIIAETASGSENVPFGVKQGLGSDLAAAAAVYHWPRELRPKDEKGRSGSLHMKVAIADSQHLFVTSANLTAYALSLNMELGILLHSQKLSSTVIEHLQRLIEAEVFMTLGRPT